MSMESLIYSALQALVAGRVYPDVGPDMPTVPYITYQQVGGAATNFLDNAQPGKANARMQVSVWATTRSEAALLAQKVETAMRAAASLSVTVSGAPLANYDPTTKYRGTVQFFSCWADITA